MADEREKYDPKEDPAWDNVPPDHPMYVGPEADARANARKFDTAAQAAAAAREAEDDVRVLPDKDADESVEQGEERGTGPYESRTIAQLREVARDKGLPVSGSKEELIERLRNV